jgi:hypothetical protein
MQSRNTIAAHLREGAELGDSSIDHLQGNDA